jgi:hypothetical protein
MRKRTKLLGVLGITLAALVLGSCDDFFATSWAKNLKPREFDVSKVDVTTKNLDQIIEATRASKENSQKALEKIAEAAKGATGTAKKKYEKAALEVAGNAVPILNELISDVLPKAGELTKEGAEIDKVINKDELLAKANASAADAEKAYAVLEGLDVLKVEVDNNDVPTLTNSDQFTTADRLNLLLIVALSAKDGDETLDEYMKDDGGFATLFEKDGDDYKLTDKNTASEQEKLLVAILNSLKDDKLLKDMKF